MNDKMKKRIAVWIPIAFAFFVWYPILFLVGGSFMGQWEIVRNMGPVFTGAYGYATWSLMPTFPTLRPYVELLLDRPEFFVQFWNTVKISFLTVLGQVLVAAPAAWWFACCKGKGGRMLFSLYIVLMLMPFQVTMVSNYLVSDYLNILNTHTSIIFPAIFSSFPVFIMYRYFTAIPDSIVEAARMDGANNLQVFLSLAIPIGKGGVVTAMILGFLEAWNLVEQPMVFLTDASLWPLSLYLPEISIDNIGIALAASVVTLLPSVLVFLLGQEYIQQGMTYSGIKE